MTKMTRVYRIGRSRRAERSLWVQLFSESGHRAG